MTVAVVVPCFNERPERIAATVRSALEVGDLVVISDDGSSPCVGHLRDEPLWADRGRIVWSEDNQGPASAMNAGVALAIAEGATRIARIDVGDKFHPEAKHRQLEQRALAVFSRHHDLVTGEDFSPPPNWANRIYTDGAFCICSMVVDVVVWQEVGGFDPALRYGDDWDFAIRVQQAIGWTFFDEVTCEAGAFPGGHTMSTYVDEAKAARRHEDTERIRAKVRALRGRR